MTVQQYLDVLSGITADFQRCEFRGPASAEAVAAFEQETGLHIPVSYREFLLLANGGTLSGGSTELYGVGNVPHAVGFDLTGGMIPDTLLPLGFFDAKHICWDKQRGVFLFYEYEAPEEIDAECVMFDDFNELLGYLTDILTG